MEMSKVKQDYIPLHERIQSASEENKKTMMQQVFQKDELNDLYRSVFETPEGQRLLSHLVNSYIGHIPAANATPNEIMFQHGQNYIIHDILNKIRRK